MNILKKIMKKEQKNACCNIMIEEVGEKQEDCCEVKEEKKDERKA